MHLHWVKFNLIQLMNSLSGFTIFGLSAAGLTAFPFTIASALLYGTICAAVDPVAVSQ